MADDIPERQLRRIVTAEGPHGSEIWLAAPPSAHFAGLFEIWSETLGTPLDPRDRTDLGPEAATLRPPGNGVAARWFIVEPRPPGIDDDRLDAAISRSFERLGAADCHVPGGIDPAMHRTASLDIVCLLSGSASLILDDGDILLSPGEVVVQRGTAHAWRAHGGPALFLAVLIDRAIAARTD